MTKLTDTALVALFVSLAAQHGDAATRSNADEHYDVLRHGECFDRGATEAALRQLIDALL